MKFVNWSYKPSIKYVDTHGVWEYQNIYIWYPAGYIIYPAISGWINNISDRIPNTGLSGILAG